MKLLKITAAFALLATALTVQAESPFYFVGKAAEEASLSAVGVGQRKVFLRWDTLEGTVPSEIVSFKLYRNTAEIGVFPSNEVMSPNQIAALYSGEAQQRRKLETLAALKNQALADPQFDDFPLNQFGPAYHQRLISDPQWAAIASRVDFNVARARFRAFLDNPAPGEYEYELKAVNAGGQESRVGLFVVNTAATTTVLAPEGLSQVPLGECDSPDVGKDHFTVALSWPQPGGASLADQLASRVFTAGYDLYRSIDDVPESTNKVPPRDLAAEARNATHDTQGRVVLDGLEKVNDVLLTLTGAENGEPVFIETQRDLIEDGLGLGDRRFYYLVPRDFAGQYGPTVGALVEVPNRGRPPAPWDIVSFPDQAAESPELEILWDAVNYDNYQRTFGDVNRFCNPVEAQENGQLQVVGKGEDCDLEGQRSIRLDVDGYKIYRFDSNREAHKFSDSDGDGVSDAIERLANTQCDPKLQSDPSKSRLLNATTTEFLLPETHRVMVKVRDAVPANDKDELYWYRIASYTADGRLSFLSPPTQAKFPDRTLPDPPVATVTRDDLENCGCELVVTDPNAPWSFTDTIGKSTEYVLNIGVQGNPRAEDSGDVSVHQFNNPDAPICVALATNSNVDITGIDEYPAQTGKVNDLFCQTNVPEDIDFCRQGAVELRRTSCAQVPVDEGDVVADKVSVKLEFPAGSCGSLFISPLGVKTRLKTSCGTDTPGLLEAELDSVSICGAYGSSQDHNNAISQPVYLPCVKPVDVVERTTLTAAQPVSFNIDGGLGSYQWKLPVEPVSASLVEFERQEDGETLVTSVGAADTRDTSFAAAALTLAPLLSAGETWCARVKLIGPAVRGSEAVQSAWTQPLCAIREGELAPPVFLPWPPIAAAPQGDNIEFKIGHELGRSQTVESYQPVWELFQRNSLDVVCRNLDNAIEPDPALRSLYGNPICPTTEYVDIRRSFAPFLNMIVYRQGRSPDGIEGDYQQVTPRLDRVHWDDVNDDKNVSEHRLNDPWFRTYAVEAGVDRWGFAFVDRYPLLAGYSYRYQVIKFTADNRIASWQQSNWVTPSLRLGGQ